MTWYPTRYRHRAETIMAAQVTPETARAIADWCGGWAVDDLEWSEAMQSYKRPAKDRDEHAGALFPCYPPAPGGVMLRSELLVRPGNWVVYRDDKFTFMTTDELDRGFEPAGPWQADGFENAYDHEVFEAIVPATWGNQEDREVVVAYWHEGPDCLHNEGGVVVATSTGGNLDLAHPDGAPGLTVPEARRLAGLLNAACDSIEGNT